MGKEEYELEVCTECDGGGITTALLPNGHTELKCQECEGTGYVEVEKDD